MERYFQGPHDLTNSAYLILLVWLTLLVTGEKRVETINDRVEGGGLKGKGGRGGSSGMSRQETKVATWSGESQR